MRKVLFVLAFWYLGEWAYTQKIKPFITKEFGLPGSKAATDSSQQATGNGGDTPVNSAPSAAPHTPGMNAGAYVNGLDVSHYQKQEELTTILDTHIDNMEFIICKSSDGLGTDELFNAHWYQIRKKKAIIRGAYHFFRVEKSAVEQAAHYCNTILKVGYGQSDLPPIVDFEINKGGKYPSNPNSIKNSQAIKNTQDSIVAFLTAVEKITGRRPMIYISNDLAKIIIDERLSVYHLWIAEYKKTTPDYPRHPRYWAFWQKTDSYVIKKGEDVDYDIFNGNLEVLNNFIKNSVIKK